MGGFLADTARLAKELQLAPRQVERTVQLLDEGNTVAFITRYRKEQTGNLDEEQIRAIQRGVTLQRQLAERADTIRRSIDAQGKLTPALDGAISQAASLKQLEDLYLPYRPKRRSRAQTARERGLDPLAQQIWNAGQPGVGLEAAAGAYVAAERELPDVEAVLAGAGDILAERISEDAAVREAARTLAWSTGRVVSKAANGESPEAQPFRDYFDFSEAASKIPPHRVLALNRGENLKVLRIKVAWDDERVRRDVAAQLRLGNHPHRRFLEDSVADACDRLLHPSLEREVRRELTDRAERHAVSVFARNLRSLLLQPPLGSERVLAIDPGLRTGCKLVVLDEVGRVLAHDVVYITGSDDRREAARRRLVELAREHECRVIAIGNGTACRETEELVAAAIGDELPEARYVIVNEAGASIYSASPVARDEFPDFDATVRGTISIGRRLQDPLSELVKIEPQHIGVGMYQHDLDEKSLRGSLDEVVESCVNFVGVDLNRASAPLLQYVSGLSSTLARRIVEHREHCGRFTSRLQLRDVPGVGERTFTQAAGFLKVSGGDEPLDATWIHPESYPAAERLLQRTGLSREALRTASPSDLSAPLQDLNVTAAADELQVGVPTLSDIVEALRRPGRDPRSDLAGPVFRQEILRLEDLQPGMELRGTVLNVVDFGAFVDVGLKDSGLVHISRMADRFIRDPHEVTSVGDVVNVWVHDIDVPRRRVSLTMLRPE